MDQREKNQLCKIENYGHVVYCCDYKDALDILSADEDYKMCL